MADKRRCAGPFGGLYGLGFVGALVWFMDEASGFWAHVVGILKALVWPAFLVYRAFKGLPT